MRTGTSGWPAAILFALLAVTGGAFADIVFLKNGREIRGEITSEDGPFITLRVSYGSVRIPKSSVALIERQSTLDYGLDRGQEHMRERRFDRAIEELGKACAANPDSSEARLMLAAAYRSQGEHLRSLRRYDEARVAFEELIRLVPRQAAEVAPLVNVIDGNRQRVGDMIRKGRQCLADGDAVEAVKAFETAIEFSPDALKPAQAPLGEAYARLALEASRKGAAQDARELFERALTNNPALADRIETHYIGSVLSGVTKDLSAGNTARAQAGLARALQFSPTNMSVLFVSGQIAEAQGNRKLAGTMYAKALRRTLVTDSNEAVAALRAELAGKLKYEGGDSLMVVAGMAEGTLAHAEPGDFATLESAHFTVLHHNSQVGTEAADVLEFHLSRLLKELTSDGSVPWTGKPRIYIYRNKEEYARATGQPSWTGSIARFVSGRTIGKPTIYSYQTCPFLFKTVYPHELTHLIFNGIMPNRDVIPRALHEGMSVYAEPEFRRQHYLSFLRPRLASDNYIPLSELATLKEYPSDTDFFYAESYALFAYLVQRKGLDAVLNMCRGIQAGGVEQAIVGLTGHHDFSAMEKDWKAWLLQAPPVR